MTFWRKNWYYIGGILFVLLAFIMGLWGCYRLGTIQIILVFSWMGMLMHQFEEYAFPGGFPIISNMAGLGEVDHPERYPLNARQSFLSNVILWYTRFWITSVITRITSAITAARMPALFSILIRCLIILAL